jgi:hypothetical protein
MTQDANNTENSENKNDPYALDVGLGLSRHEVRIAGRIFRLDPISARQYRDYKAIANDDLDGLCAFMAPVLAERALDGEPVTEDFVLDNVPAVHIHALGAMLLRGEPPRPNL